MFNKEKKRISQTTQIIVHYLKRSIEYSNNEHYLMTLGTVLAPIEGHFAPKISLDLTCENFRISAV